MKRRAAFLSAFLLLAFSLLTACGSGSGNGGKATQGDTTVSETAKPEGASAETPAGAASAAEEDAGGAETAPGEEADEQWELPVRVNPLSARSDADGVEVTPNTAPYTVNADLSNIDNLWQYYLQDEVKDLLVKNGFSVDGSAGNEFFEIYESNRYEQKASFVTVDSLMHTYHLYYSYLMRNLEKGYLSDSLLRLSQRMLADSAGLYEQMKGSEWEDAARRCLLLFSVGTKLLAPETELNPDVASMAEEELGLIQNAGGIARSRITGLDEDYSQYIPRGYYEGDEQLERYFRAMMLYGRMHFKLGEDDLDRSAILIAYMMSGDADAYGLWQAVYDVTSFFAGASDDLGVDEYLPILHKVYGDDVTGERLAEDGDGLSRFQEAASRFAPPAVNSTISAEDGDNAALGFRFLGQRFTIDAAVMQQLVHDQVKDRMLPDVLDVPAALGSETALSILAESGNSGYEGYQENMLALRDYLSKENEDLWSASLYSGWLDTLRPLLEEKGEGYPTFMQSEEWAKKDLECFAGSFTELKHDTVLYTKQVIAEMGGGGYEQIPDDRGYVEPEPQVYARFSALANRTAQGLEAYGMLSDADRENLSRLSQMADTLTEISVKELRDETLTEDEYEFIRGYGGSLEHFWIETVQDYAGGDMIATQECPAALVVDVATGSGQVLELATDVPSLIRVIVKVDGKLKIATGSVYSFYQFTWPASDRLTDSKWRQMRGVAVDESGYYNRDTSIKKPDWTLSYRYLYGWE